MKKRIYFGLPILLLSFSFIIAAVKSDVFFEIKKNFSIFSDVFSEVSLRYVDEVEPGSLIHTGIDAMLEMLDPYTVLIDENKNQEIDIITTGKYAGVGLEVGMRKGEVVVIAPVEGYSAEKKGVKAGDIIVEINGIPIKELNEKAIEAQLFGEPGSTVSIAVKRFGIDNLLIFNLEREQIDVKSVPYAGFVDKEKGWVYVQLSQFSQNSATEVKESLAELKKETEIKAVVLDLRNNPGGLLSEAVSLLNIFLPQGLEVVTIKGRQKENNQNFLTREPAFLPDAKLIVLQNNGSASASEIVAGALQDLDRAVIIGTRSYGKGLVQTIHPISYNNSLKITTSRYYIPSGRSIQSLRYSHLERNEFEDVPDSLRKAFKTRNGRVVYDGIGIEPDVALEERTLDILEIALLKDSQYFYFANEYVAKNDTITSADVKGKVFEDFKHFLVNNKFEYETEQEFYFNQLKESANWSQDEDRLLEQMKKVVETHKAARFDSLSGFIQMQLYQEIAGRYLEAKDLYPILLSYDRALKESLGLLSNEQMYFSYLTTGKKRG